jgi:hypothetical protein
VREVLPYLSSFARTLELALCVVYHAKLDEDEDLMAPPSIAAVKTHTQLLSGILLQGSADIPRRRSTRAPVLIDPSRAQNTPRESH